MKKVLIITALSTFLIAFGQTHEKKEGHENTNRFRQLSDKFAAPNQYRTASGTPGAKYYQQRADYKMNIVLDDNNQKIFGEETITYTNNSPNTLEYLWVQLDQNVRAKDSKSLLVNDTSVRAYESAWNYTKKYLKRPFDGGFNIDYVKDKRGNNLPYTINQTMMRIDIKKPLKPKGQISFKIKWWYNIPNYLKQGGRSGFEYFPEEDNYLYIIAQFFPRICVYNDVDGWQNSQFWGTGEFALPFGNYQVAITAPADHILDGTGKLINRHKVFTKQQFSRWKQASKNFTTPVIILNQEEVEKKEKEKSKETKTWRFRAENVRDFAFASSRKFIYEAMAVNLSGTKKMAISMYPKEGNPLWGKYSTQVVANTLKIYSKYTFDYPYHKAISVHAKGQGMEYPMICWNYGRPKKNGTYSDKVKYGMISVITHEIGHNFFPMVVNSDERKWTWMDEGLNSFLQYLTEQEFRKKYLPEIDAYPSRRGPAKNIVQYMKGNQSTMTPIMSTPENIYSLGNNAYGKTASGLNILRETIMGHRLFDNAFRTYANRWKFKTPTPEDFFRTMEDASAIDLDWFWRAWFYTTDYVDLGIKQVRQVYLLNKPPSSMKAIDKFSQEQKKTMVFSSFDEKDLPEGVLENTIDHSKALRDYVNKNFNSQEQKNFKPFKYLYEVTFEKKGGVPMPILLDITYEDNTTEFTRFPVQIWRKNDKQVKRVIGSDKKVIRFQIDKNEKTADIDTSNNIWIK